jgi:hypothetical protein
MIFLNLVVEQLRVDQRARCAGAKRKDVIVFPEHLDRLDVSPGLHNRGTSLFSEVWVAMPLFPAFCFFLYAQSFQPLEQRNRD